MSDETFTQEQVEEMVKERLAAAKAEQDKAFKSLWEEAKEAKRRAQAFADLGDPDEVKGRLARITEMEAEAKAAKAGITSEQLTKMRSEIRAELEKDYAKFKEQAEVNARKVRELQLDSVVKAQMAKNGVRADRIDPLFKLTRDEYDLTDDGVPMLRDRPGTEIGKYISGDLVKAYPEFFEGTGSSGGGASKSASGAGGGARNIAADDAAAFLANLEGIAKGTVKVS